MRQALVKLSVLTLLAVIGSADANADDPARELTPEVALKEIQSALQRNDEKAIAEWLPILARAEDPKILKKIIAIGLQYPAEPVATGVRVALASVRETRCIDYYATLLKKPKNRAQAILVIEALGFIPAPETITPLAESLNKLKDNVLIVEILRALRNKPAKEAIDALIRFHGKVEDLRETLWAETRISLAAITGYNYESHQDWSNWWLLNRDSWKPPSNTDVNRAKTGVFRPRPDERKVDLPKIFGLEVSSKRVVFVIDCSGSMEKRMKTSEDSDAPEDGDLLPTRLEMAQRELIKAIDQLRDDVHFGVIAYNKKVMPFREDSLLRASRTNKRRAIKFVQDWKPESTTSTEPAMMTALGIPDVDTVILLSDGSPTDGRGKIIKPWLPIVDRLTADNRWKRVTIHTLCFEGANFPFMEQLAGRNNGTMSNIK